jgi:hypothetical protein
MGLRLFDLRTASSRSGHFALSGRAGGATSCFLSLAMCMFLASSGLLAGCDRSSTVISITPPATLTLDGVGVSSGQFVVNEAEVFVRAGGRTVGARAEPEGGFPVTVGTEMNGGSHDLFGVPKSTQAVRMKGYFDASEPDLPPANFDLTLYANFSNPIDLTLFLPSNTADDVAQISSVPEDGSEGSSVFNEGDGPSSDTIENSLDTANSSGSSDPGRLDVQSVGASLSGLTVSVQALQPHGLVRGTPTVQGSSNTCGASPDQMCNGVSECPDGSDEAPDVCSDQGQCCVATNGCPGETGAGCGDGCCCCPSGQACSQSNPSIGCVSSP